MKKNCSIVIFTSVFLMTNLFAQEAKIELPELSTEVSGVDVVAKNDSLPDFKLVIDMPPSSEDIVPVLPEEDIVFLYRTYYKNFHSDTITITGGEPFLKEDLNSIVKDLYESDENLPVLWKRILR